VSAWDAFFLGFILGMLGLVSVTVGVFAFVRRLTKVLA
jgi:hypothetical protein